MAFEINLRKYFTPRAIAQILETLPPLETPILDTFYPESKRKQHQLPVLGIDEITRVVKNVPVVRRGTQAVPVGHGERAITYLEPQPIEVSTFVSAKELNDLKLLQETSIQGYVSDKIDFLRQIVRKTTEALAAQSLKGSITYPMKTAAGYDTYTVDFGSTNAYTPGKLWNASDIKVSDILKDLLEMVKIVKRTSGYGNVQFFAGASAYMALANVVLNSVNTADTIEARISEKGVTLAGFQVNYLDAVYENPATGEVVSAIDDDSVVAVAMDAPFTLWYCAIDDIDAGLVALPFYAVPDTKKNPSGVEIIGKSKPLPVSVPKAICWAKVV